MNIQTHIPEPLWEAIANAYDAENYSHAILDAVHYVGSLLRERAGVDGDGATLVGQALGGDQPKLKLNSLLTESEKNVQKGFEQILRGIFTGIRNPRSHEQTTDSKETADAIIHFLGYVVTLLNASKEAFTPEAFVAHVFDPEFVESDRYAELIVAEVPKLRIGDAIVALYESRHQVELRKLRFLISALQAALTTNQLSSYLSVVSEELQSTTDDAAIRTALQMLKPEFWPEISELVRLRIENKLINGIRKGEVLQNGKTTQALPTWANTFLKSFTLRSDAANALISRLQDKDSDARHYVAKFFLSELPEIASTPAQSNNCIRAIVFAIKNDDENVRHALINCIRHYPSDWQSKLADALVDLTDKDNPAVRFDDGTPFLSSPFNGFDDDIPF